MSEARIKELLQELLQEVEQTKTFDDESLDMLNKFQGDVQDLIDPAVNTEDSTAVNDAIALEASFAATHPTAEYIIREIINSLGRMGV